MLRETLILSKHWFALKFHDSNEVHQTDQIWEVSWVVRGYSKRQNMPTEMWEKIKVCNIDIRAPR